MPDLRQALKDFVATSNSGKYADEATLLSKFPELKGYNASVLRDFVATANSGKYATEDELLAKFPEFNMSAQQPVAQAPVAEDVKKKGSTMVSPSEDGGLVQQKPKVNIESIKLQKSDDKRLPEMPDMAAAASEFEASFKEKQKSDKALAAEKKKAGDLFDRQMVMGKPIQRAPGESPYLKDRLSVINRDLIKRGEEYVVPEMEYQFGELGFKFEQAVPTKDFMDVTAPDGKKTRISLGKGEAEAKRLQEFIKSNTPQRGLFVLEQTLREQDKKFNTQKQVDAEVKKVNDETSSLNQKQKAFLLKKSAYDNQISELERTPSSQRNTAEFNAKIAQVEQQRAALNEEMKAILGEEDKIKAKALTLDNAVGKYTIAKAKQGTWLGGLGDAFLTGVGKEAAGLGSIGIDIITEVLPTGFAMNAKELRDVTIEKAAKLKVTPPAPNQSIEDWKKTLTPSQLDQWEDEIDDYARKSLKKDLLPSVREGLTTLVGDPDTTPEWTNLKKQDFWGGAFLGLAESLPAMIGGTGTAGWAQRTAQMYAQVSDGLAQEMENDPDFADISENEKTLITLPIGIVSAVLEAYGLKNVLASKGIINSITMSVLGKAGRGVGAKTFRELVENEVESRFLRGALTIGAAGLAEGETGALQEVSETTFKAIYNEMKGKDMFELPESALDFIENIVVAGAQEAVGGFVLGVPSAVSAAYSQKGFLKMDDITFQTFENMANDESLQNAYIASLKEKTTQGLITAKQAREQLNDYLYSVGLFRQLPDGLTTQQKKEAMNLLKEKKDLEQYVQGKDPAMVTRQKNRIDEINQELTKISEQDVIQEQAESVPASEVKIFYRGTGNNVMPSDNDNVLWVAEDEEVAKNYAGRDASGQLNVEEVQLPMPSNPVELPYVLATDVRGSDIGNNLRSIASSLLEEGKLSQESAETVFNLIKEFESKAGNDLELFTTKVNKEESSEAFSKAVQAMGFDSIMQKESAAKGGKKTATYGVFKKNFPSLIQTQQDAIQEQAAGQVPVQSGTGVSQEVAQGVPQAEPQVTAEEGVQEEVVSSKTQATEEIQAKIKQLEKEKVSLTSKALKQVPNSPIQLRTRARIDEVNNELETLKTQINEQVQSQRTGDGRGPTTSREIAPLEGAPTFKGAKGPDPQLVAVAEDYAAKNGIEFKRQSEYVEVDEERAKRIADAYEQMVDDPQNPKVKEAYEELVKQTIAQYQALVDAGYKFWFIDPSIPSNAEYSSSPMNAMRDLRDNKVMGVFPTTEGYGDSEITQDDIDNNPLLSSTGIMWPVGGLDGQMVPVLANDLFRAVHDAFGHGLEGSGFRARGEENAWQAHVRLFTGPAIGALTSETRGQNSWLNFGPIGEKNKKAKVKDTVFAPQKVGLMPEFTWTEGLAGDMTVEPVAEPVVEPVAEPVAEPVVEPVVEEEVAEEFTPMRLEDLQTDTFTRNNAIDYEEDVREDANGREYPYLSSITVEARDAEGDTIGSITRLADEDGTLSFTAEDADGNQIDRGEEYYTLGDIKKALIKQVNKQRKKEFDKEQKAKAKAKEKEAAKAAKAKARELAKQKAKEPKVEEEVVEEVRGKLDELLELDPVQKSTGQKVLDGLDGLIKDIEKFEKGTLGVNIALPVMKTILKGIRALVKGGMALNDAIKKAAKDNNVSVRDVTNGINAISQVLPIQADYDALMAKADALIARQKSRGIDEKRIVSNLDTMIRNSDVYKNATDAQRKIMEREARAKMGVGARKAASIGRVIGALKDITNVSRAEKLQIISRIRELSRDVAKDLAQDIRDLAKKGTITPVQAANIIAKFGKVNLLNEISVTNFVDYMARVFADAEYDNKISGARSKLAKARKNIATKIGIADGLMMPLQKLFAINPTLIPDGQLERYLELLEMFSASEVVLTLEDKNTVKKDVDAILKELDEQQSKADELADLFSKSDNQVFNDEGELDYAASIKKMLEKNEIDQEQAEIMRNYKRSILPQVEPTPLSEEEIKKKKEEYIAALKKTAIDKNGLPSQDERKLADRLSNLIRSTSIQNLMKLSLIDLKNLLKVTDNINNNYLPHYAQVMVEKINGINNGKVVADSVKKAQPLAFSTLYSRFKAAIINIGGKTTTGITELVRRNPLFYIDQVFGDFKTKDIFNALFEMTAQAESKFKAELKAVQNILENAEAKVARSFKLDPDATLMSKFKMMTYMIQLEYDSNKGSEQVNPAAAYLKETIKHIDGGKSRFGERDANMLQNILDKYATDGEIDIDKLYNSFNQAEKDAIKDIRRINESLKDKAQFTAAIIRGDAIDPLNNYVHLNVLHDTQALDVSAATDFLNQANNSRRPSTKAKSLIERTKGAKPLNFDVFASAQRGAKFVLLDYNLTEPIRTARRTLEQATLDLEADGRIPKMQRDVKNAIGDAFEEAVTNLLTNSILQNSFADEVIDFIGKQGYRAVLAGTGRFAAELTSNISFAILADPKAFNAGIKYKGFIMSTDAPLVMENVDSTETNRIFPTDTLSGKFVDTSILSQASGIQGRSSKNPVFNKMQQIYNLTLKKAQNVVELTADTLISTPDKIVMRPLWFGSFANEFKRVSGKEVDFNKIAANDQAYMDANKDAIQQARRVADQRSVMAGATDNAFMGILKGTIKPNQSGMTRAFNNFNNYMTRFLIFEYVTARTAIYAMVGDGSLSKKQGAAMLAAVATRMTVYTLLSQMLANGIMGLFGAGDDEEEDEKSLMQKIGQSLVGTFSSLLVGRDFGNATKLMVNYGLEGMNEKYLDFLREGEYDPYKDAIAFSLIPRDEKKNDDIADLIISMTGSLSPALKTANLIYKNKKRILTGETEKKELDAIERETRTVRERIPLEVLGNAGFIPLYKDVRKAVNNSIYSSIKRAEKAAKRTKQEELDLLGGYENKTDLKRYNPALYEKNFGEGSDWYNSTKEEREAKEKEAKLEREMKDRMYNYTPDGDDGFGSKGFGKKKEGKKKSSKGFGSKGFGKD